MDLWHKAKRAVESKDLFMARSLGFDNCQQCGEWFQLAGEDWRDCSGCGRHCQSCAESVAWEWCADCGHHYCRICTFGNPSFSCPVCMIAASGSPGE